MKTIPQEVIEYVESLYWQMHQHPEIGFDLPWTAAFVEKELDAMGVAHTDKYGKCSVVAQLGNRKDVPTVGLRADMDALPVHETADVALKSTIDGVMHACGHDSHTAILLGVIKLLKDRVEELPCNVRFFFQPSEEGAVSGAKMMVDNGCLEGVDAVACTHCELTIPTGTIGYHYGPLMAACAPITLIFHGITSHATLPERGVDAVAMAVESYGALKAMVKEEAGDRPYIWQVGKFAGGDVHNVIPDICTQEISFRFYDAEFAERVHQRILVIIDEIAKRYGGRAELQWRVSTCALINNDMVVDNLVNSLKAVETVELEEVPMKRSSEDFAWFTDQRPGMLFRYGSLNPEKGCTATPHRPDFKLDMDAFQYAMLAFVNFVENFKM